MFWQKFIELCRKVDKSPNAVAAEIGIKSSGTVTGWNNGSKPRPSIIAAICEYFGLPLEYFDDDEWDSYPDSVFHANFIGIFIGKMIFTSVFFADTHGIESVRFGIKINRQSA